jgi:hypothetical protein
MTRLLVAGQEDMPKMMVLPPEPHVQSMTDIFERLPRMRARRFVQIYQLRLAGSGNFKTNFHNVLNGRSLRKKLVLQREKDSIFVGNKKFAKLLLLWNKGKNFHNVPKRKSLAISSCYKRDLGLKRRHTETPN